MLSDKEILAMANSALVYYPDLQVAYDRLMAFGSVKQVEQYGKYWEAYMRAGGDRTMCDKGIDLDNWLRVREVCRTKRAPDLWESAPLQALSTPEADTPAEVLSTPPTSG